MFQHTRTLRHEKIRNFQLVFASVLWRLRQYKKNKFQSVRRTTVPEAIHPALKLLFKRRRAVTLNRATAACGMSRTRFARIFTELMGMGFAKFGMCYRLSSVAEILGDLTQPIKALAARWGLTDPSRDKSIILAFWIS